jgi:hypothetical protein
VEVSGRAGVEDHSRRDVRRGKTENCTSGIAENSQSAGCATSASEVTAGTEQARGDGPATRSACYQAGGSALEDDDVCVPRRRGYRRRRGPS